jgi:cobalt/nickel transport system permease protein
MHGSGPAAGDAQTGVRPAAWLHERDARAGILSLLIILIGIATTPQEHLMAYAIWAALLATTALAAQVSLTAMLRRSLTVLPFAMLFAAAVVPVRGWSGAGVLVAKTWLSAMAVLLLTESIPAPRLFHALTRLRCPSALTLVLQFLYRYLFVLGDTARNMQSAALARGIQRAPRRRAFQAAAGSIAVLFVSAHGRATRIYEAMLARGFRGHMPSLTRERLRLADGALVIGTLALVLTIHAQ